MSVPPSKENIWSFIEYKNMTNTNKQAQETVNLQQQSPQFPHLQCQTAQREHFCLLCFRIKVKITKDLQKHWDYWFQLLFVCGNVSVFSADRPNPGVAEWSQYNWRPLQRPLHPLSRHHRRVVETGQVLTGPVVVVVAVPGWQKETGGLLKLCSTNITQHHCERR